jgi:hypothetical protein
MNRLINRADVGQRLTALLAPLTRYAVPGGFHLGDFGAHYAPKIACMEAFSRTLWGVAPLVAGGFPFPSLDSYRGLLKQGVTPDGDGFWGEPQDEDQRLVEMASIALSLLLSRQTFYDALDEGSRRNLLTWLGTIQYRRMPRNNWYFFRVLVMLALRRLGTPVDEEAEKEAFDLIESFYAGDGWYRDGQDRNFDYYNPWGMHFYGLVYAKFAREPGASAAEQERAERYIARACAFARHYVHWFAPDGSSIPYGRSLTYRFAAASFWGACAFADVEALPWPVMKGMVMRNLRYWFDRPVIDRAGILTVGYGYPNLVMADRYNSPGSPYWALKSFLPLALGDDHPFWQAEEAPLAFTQPLIRDETPGFLISHDKNETTLFPAADRPAFNMNHRTEKYGKFAYSTRFGFCVSLSPFDQEQAGVDSMLFFREGWGGAWHGRSGVCERRFERSDVGHTLIAVWEPLPGARVETTIAVAGAWHLRIHRIEAERAFDTLEGGFALSRFGDVGTEEDGACPLEASSAREASIGHPWGGSRIIALETDSARTGSLVTAAPNLNVLYAHAVIPVLRGAIPKGKTMLVSAVHAGDVEAVAKEPLPEAFRLFIRSLDI